MHPTARHSTTAQATAMKATTNLYEVGRGYSSMYDLLSPNARCSSARLCLAGPRRQPGCHPGKTHTQAVHGMGVGFCSDTSAACDTAIGNGRPTSKRHTTSWRCSCIQIKIPLRQVRPVQSANCNRLGILSYGLCSFVPFADLCACCHCFHLLDITRDAAVRQQTELS